MKPCESCRFWEPFSGMCCKYDSEYCADFVFDGCEKWEEREENE